MATFSSGVWYLANHAHTVHELNEVNKSTVLNLLNNMHQAGKLAGNINIRVTRA